MPHCGRWLRGSSVPGLGVLAGWYDRSGTTGSDCLVALAGIVGAICRHGTDLFVRRDLVEQVRQDGRITYWSAPLELDGLVALIGRQDDPPLSPQASGDGLDLGPSQGRAAVHDGDADLDFCGLTIRVT